MLQDDLFIRPVKFNTDVEWLKFKSQSQRDYGFLCALADLISFELEIAGDTDEEAAILAWNVQWDLILLSIIRCCPVYWPLASVAKHDHDGQVPIVLSNIFLGPRLFSTPVKLVSKDFELYKELQESFHSLLTNARFSHAASVAATNYNEPKPSVRMAALWSAIESLLGFEHELRFRISAAVARLLEDNEKQRRQRFNAVKKLYDLRSKSVHGASSDKGQTQMAAEDSLKLLCELLILFIRRGSVLTKEQGEALFLG